MRNLETVWCCQHSRSQPRYPFKLCLDCRAEAPYEAIVVEAVVNYFSRTEFQEFVIETEKSIRMGIEPRRADIVLLDGEGHFIAIAECKRTGVVTYGREQLKSYLCATDTQFGVFANSINPDEWEFYENLRRNQFTSMGRSPFQRKIATWRTIESIRGEKNKLDWEIQKASDQYAQKTREIDSSCKQLDELKENIKRKNKQFAQIEEEVVPLRKESSDLKEENTRLKGEITQNSKRAKVVEGLKLESTHDSLRKSIDLLSEEKNKLDREIQKASDQYAQKTREIDSSCKQLDELKENIKRKNKQFAQIEEEVVPLRKESSDLKEENTRLKGEITQNSKRAKVVEGLKLESTHDSLRKSIDLLSSERNQLQNEIGTKEQQRWRLSKKINLLREDEDKLDNLSRENTDKLKRAENKIRSERGTLEREKKIWKDGEKERQNYNDYLEQINAKLEKSIKHKNDAVRDLDRLSRLDELVVCHNYLDS